LCLDAETQGFLGRHPEPGVIPLTLSWLEDLDPDLVTARGNRSRLEYYFTLSPCLPRAILSEFKPDAVVSCDADLWFMADLSGILGSLTEFPIFITAHGFSPEMLPYGLPTGLYNVSFQGFRNDATGQACLAQWRRQCLEWCRHQIDNEHGRFGDQRYLEQWPTDFAGAVQVLEPPGYGLAPWNISRFSLKASSQGLNADGRDIRFYHFHGIRILDSHWAADRLWQYHYVPDQVVLQQLYAPYLAVLLEMESRVAREIGISQPLFENLRKGPLWWRIWQARTACWLNPVTGVVRHYDYTAWHPEDRLRGLLESRQRSKSQENS
jgi:hypothetical protein